MRSFLDIPPVKAVPLEVAGLLAEIDQAHGREELHFFQAPQVLKRLSEYARFQSITASNAIEDVVLNDARALEVIRAPAGTSYADRAESEFAGYRDASDYLAGKSPEPLSIGLLTHLHRLLLVHTGDALAGKFKDHDNVIGTRDSGGRVTVIFKTVPAGGETEWHIRELVDRYEASLADARTPPIALVALLVLDFLSIHPFSDGNGRIARLLTTCELLRHGYGVARYASVEHRIFDSKNSYYAALKQSQRAWHDGEHDRWPWVTYLLRLIRDAYGDFEQRVVAARDLSGLGKAEQVRKYVLEQTAAEFRFVEIEAALPDISTPTIRAALKGLLDDGLVESERGRAARWRRTAPLM